MAINGKRMPTNLDDSQEFEKFFKNIDYIVSDCDGVLWLDDEGIQGSAQAINRLRQLGKQILFVTNNDTKTREEFCDILINFGFDANVSEIYSTPYLIAKYLKDRHFDRKVYVLGATGVTDELRQMSIESVVDKYKNGSDPMPQKNDLHSDVGAVVVGMDYKMSFRKCVLASTYIRQHDCLFLATNYDEKVVNSDGLIVPGPGAMLALIESATSKRAVTFGKPSTLFFDIIKTDYPNIDPNRCVMIGDRLVSDVLFGHNNNMKTLFVETGINSYDDMLRFVHSDQASDQYFLPNYYIKSLNDLNKYI